MKNTSKKIKYGFIPLRKRPEKKTTPYPDFFDYESCKNDNEKINKLLSNSEFKADVYSIRKSLNLSPSGIVNYVYLNIKSEEVETFGAKNEKQFYGDTLALMEKYNIAYGWLTCIQELIAFNVYNPHLYYGQTIQIGKSSDSFIKNNSFKDGGCILYDKNTTKAELIDFIKREFKESVRKSGPKQKTETINKIILDNQNAPPLHIARKIKEVLKVEKDANRYDLNYVEKKLSEFRNNILND